MTFHWWYISAYLFIGCLIAGYLAATSDSFTQVGDKPMFDVVSARSIVILWPVLLFTVLFAAAWQVMLYGIQMVWQRRRDRELEEKSR